MDDKRRSAGVRTIGWCVIAGNAALLLFHYYFPIDERTPLAQIFHSFWAMLAVFPFDFFNTYLSEIWPAHFCWIVVMCLAVFDMLRFNRFSRKVFIVLTVTHMIVLGYLCVMKFGDRNFIEWMFKFYFNLVVAGAYVGFLTISEVRESFELSGSQGRFFLFPSRRLKKVKPDDPEGHVNLGLAYLRLGRHEDAREAFEQAVELDSEKADYHFHLGRAWLELNNRHKAVDALKRAIDLDADHFEAHYQLGRAYLKLGCVPEALPVFRRALILKGDAEDVRCELARTLCLNGEYRQAAEEYGTLTAASPRDQDLCLEQGRLLYEHLHDYTAARDVLLKAARIDPRRVEIQFLLGMACLKLNRLKDALHAFQEVVRHNGRHREGQYQLGFAYAMLQDFDSARRQCRVLKEMGASDLAGNLELLIK